MKLISTKKKLVAKYLALQNNKCYYCETPLDVTEATKDHIYPKKLGHTLKNNMVVCCEGCNLLKADRPPLDFYNYLRQRLKSYLTCGSAEEMHRLRIIAKNVKNLSKQKIVCN